MNPRDQPPLAQDEEQAREHLDRALSRHGMAVRESIRGEALSLISEMFGGDSDQSNEPKDGAVRPDPLLQLETK
mgnify:CR=1 FL=1